MKILSRVCAEFRNKHGDKIYTITPGNLLVLLDKVPDEIREDPLFRMLLADKSIEVIETDEQQKKLESNPTAGFTPDGKKDWELEKAIALIKEAEESARPAANRGAKSAKAASDPETKSAKAASDPEVKSGKAETDPETKSAKAAATPEVKTGKAAADPETQSDKAASGTDAKTAKADSAADAKSAKTETAPEKDKK